MHRRIMFIMLAMAGAIASFLILIQPSFVERLQAALNARDVNALEKLTDGDPASLFSYVLNTPVTHTWRALPVRTPGGQTYIVVYSNEGREQLHTLAGDKVGEAVGPTTPLGFRFVQHELHVRVQPDLKLVSFVDEADLELDDVGSADDPLVKLHHAFRVKRVVIAGSESEFVRARGFLWLPRPSVSRVRIRFEYEVSNTSADGIKVDVNRVVCARDWIPSAGTRPAPFRLTIVVPPAWAVLATGSLLERTDAEATSTAVFDSRLALNRSAFVTGRYTRTERRLANRTLVAAFSEASSKEVESLADAYAAAWARYAEWFGELPWESVMAVDAGKDAGLTGAYGNVIVLRPEDVGRAPLRELAAVWWGGVVADSGAPGLWSEVFPGYCASLYRRRPLGVSPELLNEVNSARSHGPLPPGWEEIPLARCDDLRSLRQATILRVKGPLVLTYLERTIGFENMLRAMREFRRFASSGAVGWGEFEKAVSAAAQKDMTTFFDQWLRSPGLPDLVWADLKLTKEEDKFVVIGELLQGRTVYSLTVEVVAVNERGWRWHGTVDTSTKATPVRLQLPFRPSILALDPYLRIPRIYDPEGLPPTVSDLAVLLRRPDTVVVLPPDRAEQAAQQLAPFRNVKAVLADRVSEEELDGKNLVLVGDPVTNPVWLQMAHLCPFSFAGDWLVLGDDKFTASTHFALAAVEVPGPTVRSIVFATDLRLGPTGVDFASNVVLNAKGEVVAAKPAIMLRGDGVWQFSQPDSPKGSIAPSSDEP